MEANRHFNVVVIGDNHAELIKKYDSNVVVAPYVVYEFARVADYRKTMTAMYKKALECDNVDNAEKEYIRATLDDWKNLSDIEFYDELTQEYELDEETGNAMSTRNPNGKHNTCNIAKNFAVPFILKDGTEAFSAKKKDIDWDKVHLANTEPYEVAWDTVMEHKEPKTEGEKIIYNNMKERTHYFSLFGTRENYIKCSTAFWGYAFLSEKTGWVELEDTMPQFEWVSNFYDKFIKPLPENTLITIYECLRT